uniref:Uncharacterized protein n=1 Tax=Solanum lycopersicum TaxID=4081 RepID=A0A3Q7IGK2_SOLLC
MQTMQADCPTFISCSYKDEMKLRKKNSKKNQANHLFIDSVYTLYNIFDICNSV